MHSFFTAPAGGALLFFALVASLLILLNASAIGAKLEIMDIPDNFRKKHARPTPLVGGLAIMIPVVLWAGVSLLWGPQSDLRLMQAVLLCGAGATLVGYADDQRSTSPSSRLLSLFLLMGMAVVIDPALIPAQLNWGSFEPTRIPEWFAVVFVAVAMTGYVNAVNMADGQNGIVSGMFVIWAICLLLVSGGSTANVAQVLFVTVLATFVFNLAGRVFLGDSGSYGIAFVYGLLAIDAHNNMGVSAETIAVWFFIPVMDCIRLMVARALQGQAPSNGDSDHFHHRLQLRVGRAAGLCTYLGVVGASSVIASLVPHLALVCMVVLAAFYFSFAWLTETDVEGKEEGGSVEPTDATRPRLMSNSKVLKFDGRDSSAGKD